jgi:uncharacterized protein
MRKIICIFLLLLGVQTFAQKSIPRPNPPRLFNDNAGVVAKYDADDLERKLVAFDDSTSNQIAVVIVKTLNDEPIEDVAVNTYRDWGLGTKKNNNGVLLIVAIDDRKVRIEVGYGLEGAIPDITANDIIENDLKPAFRQNNYYSGINKAVDDISKAAAGEYKIQREKHSSNRSSGGGGALLKFILILVFVLFIVMRGGGSGGGGGLGWVAPMLLMNSMGGGGRSSWGGGDSGGGGFGGFGGGSSGGGGASGSW